MVSNRRERAQLVLIAALLVATAILGAVVLLNTIHSSPDVKAQTDAQSVQDTERMTAQIQADLRSLFLATSTEEGDRQRQFADGDEFEDAVEAYEEQFVERVSSDRAAVPSIELVDEDDGIGDFITGDQIRNIGNGEALIEDANRLPYLRVTVPTENDAPVYIELYDQGDDLEDDPAKEIILRGDETDYGDPDNNDRCDAGVTDGEDGVTVELRQGSGEIRSDDESCQVQLYESDEFDSFTVRIDSSRGGGEGEGTVAEDSELEVSGAGGTINEDATEEYETQEGVYVDPRLEVTYDDPNVEYEGIITLFGGGGS